MTTTTTANTSADVLAITPDAWRAATTADRDRAAFVLRSTGFDLRSIGQALGFGRGTGTISRAIAREVRRRGTSPTTTTVALSSEGRRFGIEIEVVRLNVRQAVAALRAAGIDAVDVGYTHRVLLGQWKVVTDASVQGGCEVVSPILSGEAGFAAVRTVMEALRTAGADVNSSCGVHVHHEVSDLTGHELASIVEFYAGHQAAMDSLVAPSRRTTRGNWACAAFSAEEVRRFGDRFRRITASDPQAKVRQAQAEGFGSRPNSRYRVLNVHSFGNYGTIEFRQHQGTTNGTKAVAWIMLGQAIIEAARTASTVRTTEFVADLVAAGHLDSATGDFLARRQAALR